MAPNAIRIAFRIAEKVSVRGRRLVRHQNHIQRMRLLRPAMHVDAYPIDLHEIENLGMLCAKRITNSVVAFRRL